MEMWKGKDNTKDNIMSENEGRLIESRMEKKAQPQPETDTATDTDKSGIEPG